jgi:hypothetical protein
VQAGNGLALPIPTEAKDHVMSLTYRGNTGFTSSKPAHGSPTPGRPAWLACPV